MPPSQDRKSTRLNSSHVEISYAVFCLTRPHRRSPLFPYTTLFRSHQHARAHRARARVDARAGLTRLTERTRDRAAARVDAVAVRGALLRRAARAARTRRHADAAFTRSEEHTSELQSRRDLVCRLLLDPPTPPLSTLSLHDALPISSTCPGTPRPCTRRRTRRPDTLDRTDT